jgi:hypothetical protein
MNVCFLLLCEAEVLSVLVASVFLSLSRNTNGVKTDGALREEK